ncbi:PspC domain-containing protein [Corynebacterium caspium]|uniref:PspC domain-containing protein n=1 Tax=Corynebacterium caspium TaxID=234828 RepID=UPI0003774DAC|nr:PspC domain-containing protein [Corynebacterium caspium]WKD59782.1 PspC domain protein [Corynebacterium caspium DSM 44850]
MDNQPSLGTAEFWQNMWKTRPYRLPHKQGSTGAKFLGVCEGIGVRYRIDPTLIRICFIFAALSSIGILAYILAWIIMPVAGQDKKWIDIVFKYQPGELNENEKIKRFNGYIILNLVALAIITRGFYSLSLFGGLFLFGIHGNGHLEVLVPLFMFAGLVFLHYKEPVPPYDQIDMSPYLPKADFPTPPISSETTIPSGTGGADTTGDGVATAAPASAPAPELNSELPPVPPAQNDTLAWEVYALETPEILDTDQTSSYPVVPEEPAPKKKPLKPIFLTILILAGLGLVLAI